MANVERRAAIGGFVWIVAVVQYFEFQFVTAANWIPPYSWTANYISDLGNTSCGMSALPHQAARTVCSPLFGLMNTSFVAAGVLTILGTVLLWRSWTSTGRTAIALVLLVLAGAGKVLVGLVPEDVNVSLHLLGALNLPLTSVAILLLALSSPGGMRTFGLVMAVLGLVGFVLSIAGQFGGSALYLGLGPGGAERLAGYPGDVWMFAVGAAALRAKQPHAITAGVTNP